MKKGVRPNVDMFFKKKIKFMEQKKIKIKYYKFLVACSCKFQNGMLYAELPHSVWQKAQNNFPFERN